jgi:hypothetical protein
VAVDKATDAPHGPNLQVAPVSFAENGCKLTPHPLIPNIRILVKLGTSQTSY